MFLFLLNSKKICIYFFPQSVNPYIVKLSIVDDEPTLDVRTMFHHIFFIYMCVGVLRNITDRSIDLIINEYILLSDRPVTDLCLCRNHCVGC